MIYTAHSQKKRTQIVHSVNTRTQKLVDHLNEHDWGLFTSSYGKLPMKNDMAVRDLNYAVIEGLSSWTGKKNFVFSRVAAGDIGLPVYGVFYFKLTHKCSFI